MSLQVSFEITDNCTSFSISETTLAYNVSTNTTGYGAPNTLTSDISSVSIVLTDPDGTVFTFDATDTGTDSLTAPYPTYFPDSVGTDIYVIPNTAVGLASGSNLTEGLWKFVFTLVADDLELTYTKTYYYLVGCTAECCVQKMLLQVTSLECTDCTNRVMDKATQAFMFLEIAKKAALNNEPVLAQSMLDNVNLICAAFDCNSCT